MPWEMLYGVWDIHLIWQRCPSLEWNQPRDQAKSFQKVVETSFEATEEFLIQVKNNVLIKKELKKISHYPRVCTIMTKTILLTLLVHRCPKMNLHTDNTCRGKQQISTLSFFCYCNTWQNLRSFNSYLLLTLHWSLLKFHLLEILS